MVVGLCLCPSVCFCQIFHLSEEVRNQNRIFAFGAKEFQDLFLFNPEVELGGPCATCRSSGGGHPGGVLVLVIASVDCIVITINVVVVVLVDLMSSPPTRAIFHRVLIFLSEKKQLISYLHFHGSFESFSSIVY
jgi:hypothetical protein